MADSAKSTGMDSTPSTPGSDMAQLFDVSKGTTDASITWPDGRNGNYKVDVIHEPMSTDHSNSDSHVLFALSPYQPGCEIHAAIAHGSTDFRVVSVEEELEKLDKWYKEDMQKKKPPASELVALFHRTNPLHPLYDPEYVDEMENDFSAFLEIINGRKCIVMLSTKAVEQLEKGDMDKQAERERKLEERKKSKAEAEERKRKREEDAKERKAKKEAEDKAKREKKEAEEKVRREKKEAEDKAKREKKEAEEKAKQEKKEAEEKARQEKKAEEKAKQEKKDAEEKAKPGKKEAEGKAKQDNEAVSVSQELDTPSAEEDNDDSDFESVDTESRKRRSKTESTKKKQARTERASDRPPNGFTSWPEKNGFVSQFGSVSGRTCLIIDLMRLPPELSSELFVILAKAAGHA